MTFHDFKDYIFGRLLETYWTIGFSQKKNVKDYSFNDIQWITYDATKAWYADPFILDYDDNTITLIVEEFLHTTGIARISKLVVDRNRLKIINVTPLIEEPTHLSFPAMLRQNDNIYIYPENYRSGKLSLYKLNETRTKCIKVGTIAEGPFADTVIYESNGKYVMMTTCEPNANGRELYIYESSNETCDYIFSQKVLLKGNEARNAGAVIEEDGQIYKVSQDNNSPIYGYGIIFHEIGNGYTLKEVNHVVPQGKFIGVHTMNQFKNLVVWDGKKYMHPHIAPIIKRMLKFYQNYLK